MRAHNRDSVGRFKRGTSGNPNGRTPGVPNKRRHLPPVDAVAAVALADHGHTPAAIADALHASPEAVKDALGHAGRLLKVNAPKFAAHWLRASERAAEDGDHRPALAALQSIKVVEPVVPDYESRGAKAVAGVSVQFIGFRCAGLPPLPEEATITIPPAEPQTE